MSELTAKKKPLAAAIAAETQADEAAPNLSRHLAEAEAEDATNYDEEAGNPQAVQAAADSEAEEAEEATIGAELSAGVAVMLAENTALAIWPFLEFDEKTRTRTVELLVPIIVKYGGELPPWLAAYKEELMLGGHVALIGLQVARQIKIENLRLEELARRKAQNDPIGTAAEEAAA